MQALVNTVSNIAYMLQKTALYINGSKSSLSKEEIREYIISSFPNLTKECNRLDELIEKERYTLNKDRFISKIKDEFTNGKAGFDKAGFFIGYYDLKSKILNPKEKMVIYDGVFFELNINNYMGNEQIILGTSTFP